MIKTLEIPFKLIRFSKRSFGICMLSKMGFIDNLGQIWDTQNTRQIDKYTALFLELLPHYEYYNGSGDKSILYMSI